MTRDSPHYPRGRGSSRDMAGESPLLVDELVDSGCSSVVERLLAYSQGPVFTPSASKAKTAKTKTNNNSKEYLVGKVGSV